MPVLKFEEVRKDLQNRKFAPVYFLHGEESYYIDYICDFIEQNALQEFEKGFNQVMMYGKDSQMGQIINYARRFPMMAERQVVIIKEFQDLPELRSEEGQKMLQKYLENPVPTTILVLAHKHKTFDKRKSLYKTLEKNAVVVETKKPYDNELPKWIEQFVAERKCKITPVAVTLLVEFVGSDLSRLAKEIEKITINFTEGQNEITEELVRKYVGESREYTIFDLQKALQEKDVFKANKIAYFFAQNPKDNPIIPIILILFQFFTKLLILHQSKDKSETHLAEVLGVNRFFVKDYLKAAQNYPLPKVIACIHYLHEADLRSKGIEAGSMEESDILKELIFKILH
ncbi:MAG: DNA polymerase III subunit delta [Raineya sp.]|nr:DNA polymerase III subunit delta [Raineya sp.]MDW8296436.1 DNA polymerase III subunit delta [Raineya sp.]